MNIVEIREEAELQRLRPAWEALLRESASNTIFLTWEWITAWWRSYGSPGGLRIWAAFDEKNVLRGIAPLCYKKTRKYWMTRPVLTFLGDGSNDSDYLDFIAAKGFEKDVMELFGAYWADRASRQMILTLNEVPAGSPCLSLLRKLAQQSNGIWTETDAPCGTVRLPDNWEDYLKVLRPRFRTKVRSVLRNLQSWPEVQFGFCSSIEQVRRMLPVLFDLHTRRWAQEGKPGVFRWDRKRNFYFDVSAALFERGWLRFSWLAWKDQVLACQYGFAYGGTYFHLQEGYEPASEHWNVGIGLRGWTIQQFLDEGLQEYDFLSGLGRHKTDWGAEGKQSKYIQLTRRSTQNAFFCQGPEWENHARKALRSVIPEKLLTWRQQYLERQSSNALCRDNIGNTAQWSGRSWMRKAAANCYFHSRLPMLARSFRDKRKMPCARILYYHRVNDERDSFFPAISTELFEQEMRFVSRHYRVVSLTKLLTHLQEGSPGLVIAITFDDGYGDNYQNAFPILQRYGLPATIFLTTGAIDSRELLWFEQLAHALKKTDREYVDLEIDVPRRLCMRTRAERLDSHQQIFRLLRFLPDSDRKYWLRRILGELAVLDEGERKNKMLTWNEIRFMKTHGIDFGGHTVTHPFLSSLTPERAIWEVSECKRRIEEELQLPADYFAYPNGRKEDFSNWSKELLDSAGYRAAVTTMWGMNYQSTDRLELRRGGPWEENAALFAYKFDWYQLVNA